MSLLSQRKIRLDSKILPYFNFNEHLIHFAPQTPLLPVSSVRAMATKCPHLSAVNFLKNETAGRAKFCTTKLLCFVLLSALTCQQQRNEIMKQFSELVNRVLRESCETEA